MKVFKFLAAAVFLANLTLFAFIQNVFAVDIDDPRGSGFTKSIVNPVLPDELSALSGETFLQKLLRVIILLFLIVGSIYFFFTLIMGGIKWISSGSDKAGLESAQKQLTNAFVGLAILFSSFAIIKLIEYVFGISILEFSLPTL